MKDDAQQHLMDAFQLLHRAAVGLDNVVEQRNNYREALRLILESGRLDRAIIRDIVGMELYRETIGRIDNGLVSEGRG